MLEWETLTCHLLLGLPSSWRVSALIFVTGISHFLVLSHSWVPLHAVTCAALPSTRTPPLPLASASSMPVLEPVSGTASSPGVATSVLPGHWGMMPQAGAVLAAITVHHRRD